MPKPWLLEIIKEIMQEILKMENIENLWNSKAEDKIISLLINK
jgi:hypothetical protein